MNLCTFTLSGRVFGVDILHVKEVVMRVRIAPVPHAPSDVAGLVNIRGKLHLVADLGRIFGFPPAARFEDASVVLFKPAVGESFGVIVDAPGDVVPIEESTIEDRRAGEAADVVDERRKARPGLALGVAKRASGLIVVLDSKAILPSVGN